MCTHVGFPADVRVPSDCLLHGQTEKQVHYTNAYKQIKEKKSVVNNLEGFCVGRLYSPSHLLVYLVAVDHQGCENLSQKDASLKDASQKDASQKDAYWERGHLPPPLLTPHYLPPPPPPPPQEIILLVMFGSGVSSGYFFYSFYSFSP